GLWAQPRLTEAGGGRQAPGNTVVLSCRGTSFRFEYSAVLWYRQAPGATLEWISVLSYDSSFIKYGQSVQGRATASRDNSRSEASLSLHALQPRDSARYFCAVGTE
ncbi:HVC33 protein, partial [Centropus bengalensis]|nr:HVC33 protein [Centropus bengalensis]